MGTTRGNAAVYVRLSRDRDGETSTERQERECRRLAQSRGLEVRQVYADRGLGGYKRGVERPGFDQLLADVGAAQYDALIVWKLDRVTRQGLRALGALLDVLDRGDCSLISATEGIDTSTGIGEMVAGLLAGIARQESENISVRTRSAKRLGAERGRPNGGGRGRPFGYSSPTFDAIVDDEAKVLHEARDRLLGGESMTSIAEDLNERGIFPTAGARWTGSKLGRTLRSPYLAGIRVHRGERLPGEWEPIFTVKEHEAVVLALGEHHAASVRAHLLTGFAVCSLCGANLRGKSTRRYGFQYECRGCARVTVRGAPFENLIGEAVLNRLGSADLQAALKAKHDRDDTSRVERQVADDQEALAQLTRDHYIARIVPRDVFTTTAAELEQRIAEAEAWLRQQAHEDDGRLVSTGALKRAWDSGELDFRRQVLATVVEKVTVSPATSRGPGFDPDRIDVAWKV